MPPVWSSRRVLPAGFCAVEIKCAGPASLHPPGFGFAVDSDDLDAVGAKVGLWIGDATDGFLQNLHASYSVERLILRTSTETGEVSFSAPGAMVGDDLLTPAVACLVRLGTATPGRRGTGRMYWPGVLGDGDVDNAGRIDNDPRFTELQGCADQLVTELDDGGLSLVLLHSYRWPYGDADPGVPVGFPVPSPVTGISVQRIVATQRRRQR